MNRKTLYGGIVAVAFAFTVWTLLHWLVIDPQASDFLIVKAETDTARPIKLPAWLRVLDVHIAFACISMIAGALNFSGKLRAARPKWHRAIGYAYIVSVFGVIVTSGYMAPYATGGQAVGMAFNLLNIVWMSYTIVALVQIKRRRVPQHRNWMIRSYSLVFTNMGIHLFETVLARGFGMNDTDAYATSVFVTIAALLVAAEVAVRGVRK